MTTTAVFAEIIVVGLEAEAWLALLVLAIFGTDWVDLEAIDQWAALVTVLAVASAYVLGIIIDRFADSVVKSVAKGIRTLLGKHKPERIPHSHMRLVVLKESEGIAKFLDYERSRLRVARGTIVNATFGIPSVLLFLSGETGASAEWLRGAAVAGVIVLIAAVFANERILKAYEKNLELAYRLLRG